MIDKAPQVDQLFYPRVEFFDDESEMMSHRINQHADQSMQHPLFERKQQMFYNHYTATKAHAEWSPRCERVLFLALSLHGTSAAELIVRKYGVFRGFEQRHIGMRTLTALVFHSVVPLKGRLFDVFAIHNFFADGVHARRLGFVMNQHGRYFHPTMSPAELREWFSRFLMTKMLRKRYKRHIRTLDVQKWVQLKPEHHSTIPLLANVMDLERRLEEKYIRTLKREQREQAKREHHEKEQQEKAVIEHELRLKAQMI